MTVHLFLVRHGETSMNKDRRLQGITDAPLTSKGQEAAQKLGALLAPVHFDAAFSSDRQRAIATAQAILAEHPDKPALQVRTGLREYYFGGLEGQSETQVAARSIASFGANTMRKAWLNAGHFRQLIRNFKLMDETGQAESLQALQTRASGELDAISHLCAPTANVLVVAHGVILSAMVDNLDPKLLPTTLLKNTSVTCIDAEDGHYKIRGVNLMTPRELAGIQDQPSKRRQS